ncbi:exported hypothetical protein [Vibrio chagasii]|nr:exported hypothetical protein [Vibrio chagasii]
MLIHKVFIVAVSLLSAMQVHATQKCAEPALLLDIESAPYSVDGEHFKLTSAIIEHGACVVGSLESWSDINIYLKDPSGVSVVDALVQINAWDELSGMSDYLNENDHKLVSDKQLANMIAEQVDHSWYELGDIHKMFNFGLYESARLTIDMIPSVLHEESSEGFSVAQSLLISMDDDDVEVLMGFSDLDFEGYNNGIGLTPLQIVCNKDHIMSLIYLVSTGVDPFEHSAFGSDLVVAANQNNAPHCAAFIEKIRYEITN